MITVVAIKKLTKNLKRKNKNEMITGDSEKDSHIAGHVHRKGCAYISE